MKELLMTNIITVYDIKVNQILHDKANTEYTVKAIDYNNDMTYLLHHPTNAIVPTSEIDLQNYHKDNNQPLLTDGKITRWPIITHDYVHGDDIRESDGIDIDGKKYNSTHFTDEQNDAFRYLVYEIKINLELHKDGTSYITGINDCMLDKKILSS